MKDGDSGLPGLGSRVALRSRGTGASAPEWSVQIPTAVSQMPQVSSCRRFQRATGQTEGVGRVRQVRRDIARVKTIMAEQARSAPKT